LLVYATYLVCDEESRLIKYYEGLHPKICLAISMVKPNNYQEALDLSFIAKRNIQPIEETKAKTRQDRIPIIRRNSKKEGYEQTTPFKKLKTNSRLEICKVCSKPHRGECWHKKKCFNCRQISHLRNNCPQLIGMFT
jgi:hypothetical protein